MTKAKKLQVWINIDHEDAEKLDVICNKQYWTRTQCIRRALNYYINTYDKVDLNEKISNEKIPNV